MPELDNSDPQWLFRFAQLPEQNYPQIFACLGMVVGLYGIIYMQIRDDHCRAAAHPDEDVITDLDRQN